MMIGGPTARQRDSRRSIRVTNPHGGAQAPNWSDIHDAAQTLGVPAVCFGGRDRVRHLLTRLLED